MRLLASCARFDMAHCVSSSIFPLTNQHHQSTRQTRAPLHSCSWELPKLSPTSTPSAPTPRAACTDNHAQPFSPMFFSALASPTLLHNPIAGILDHGKASRALEGALGRSSVVRVRSRTPTRTPLSALPVVCHSVAVEAAYCIRM
jgi:hypothetical protein